MLKKARLECRIRICSSKVEQPALNRQARVRSPPDPRICSIRRALISDNSISIRKTHDCRGVTNPCSHFNVAQPRQSARLLNGEMRVRFPPLEPQFVIKHWCFMPNCECLPCSSSGQEPGLSIQVMGFDSPTGRLCGRYSSGKRAGCDPAKAGSIPVRPTLRRWLNGRVRVCHTRDGGSIPPRRAKMNTLERLSSYC